MKARLQQKYAPLLQSLNDDQPLPVTKPRLHYLLKLIRSAHSVAVPIEEPFEQWLDHLDDQSHRDQFATYLNPNYRRRKKTIAAVIHAKNRRLYVSK